MELIINNTFDKQTNHTFKQINKLNSVLYYTELQQAIANNIISKDEYNSYNSLINIIKNNPKKLENIYAQIKHQKYNKLKDKQYLLKFIEYFSTCTFMPHDVFEKINTSDIYVYKSNNQILTNVYLLDKEKANMLPFISKIITVTVEILKQLFDIKQVNIDMILFGIDSKKMLPINKKTILNETNANSGDTIPKDLDLYRPMMRIYRLEEMIKVIIHETIHCSEADLLFGSNTNHPFNILHTKYNNNDLLFNETITETLAEIINCAIYSKINNKLFKDVINKEIDFGLKQTAKVLDHYGFNNINQFISNKTQIKQRTAIFEYHILKSALLFNYINFIAIVQNTTADNLLKIIIDTMYKNKLYQDKINSNFTNLDKSLRMTTIEIIPEGSLYEKYKQKYLMTKY